MAIDEDSAKASLQLFVQMLAKAKELAEHEHVDCVYRGVNLSAKSF